MFVSCKDSPVAGLNENGIFEKFAIRIVAILSLSFLNISYADEQDVASDSITIALADTESLSAPPPQNIAATDLIYPATYFTQYNPISARDMLNRIPGIDSIIGPPGGNNDRRGLGAGDNQILINGKRIAGKENDGRSVLGQIAATQVQEIQIIRGTSADIDIRSAGPIVNVILRSNASKATITAEVNADYYQQDDTFKPGVNISVNGRGERLNYLATIESEPKYEQEERKEYSVLGDGSPKDQSFENRVREQNDYKLNTTVGYQISDKDLVQINALFEKTDPPRTVEREIDVRDPNDDRLLVPGVPQLITQFDDNSADRQKWEFGLNYAHDISSGEQLKLIVVANETLDSNVLNRTSDQSGSVEKVYYVNDDRRTRERIVRGAYSRPLTDSQDFEVGLEVAQTTLESKFQLGSTSSTKSWGTSPAWGGLPGSSDESSKINEDRYEPFVVHNWQINPSLALESSLVAEFSELTQEGSRLVSSESTGAPEAEAIEKAEKFKFWKPKVDLRYDLNPSLQLRATVDRDISQLNFRDFTSRTDGDLDSNSDAGNANLVQEKTWRYEFNTEYRLPNDGGLLSARIFYHDIEDLIDRVDASYYYTSSTTGLPVLVTSSTPGNIGDGEKLGLELNSSTRLSFFGLPDAVLSAGALIQDSERTEPFTGETRRISPSGGRGSWNIDYRHDVTAWNMSYGFKYKYFIRGNNLRVDVDDTRDFWREPDSNLFVEKVAFNGIRFRFDVVNVLDNQRCLTRTRYDGFTADGVVEEVEDSCIGPGRKLALKIRTTF